MGDIVDNYGDNYDDIDDQQQYNGSVEHDKAFTCRWAIIGNINSTRKTPISHENVGQLGGGTRGKKPTLREKCNIFVNIVHMSSILKYNIPFCYSS